MDSSALSYVARDLSKNIFGFETILTALVYLSFGIFLYQMIQRAVGAKLFGMPFDTLNKRFGSVGRSNNSKEGYSSGEEQITFYYELLQKALKKVLLQNFIVVFFCLKILSSLMSLFVTSTHTNSFSLSHNTTTSTTTTTFCYYHYFVN